MTIFKDGGTIPNIIFDNSKQFLEICFLQKSVYLTLIRSPLWSLVKSAKNMLGPIFDFLTLPDLSSMAGRDIGAMESCLSLGETHWPCGEAPCLGETHLPCGEALCLCERPRWSFISLNFPQKNRLNIFFFQKKTVEYL